MTWLYVFIKKLTTGIEIFCIFATDNILFDS